MNTESYILADLRDFRLTQVAHAANCLAADQPERCIRHLRNIVATVKKGSECWKQMGLASKEAMDYQTKVMEELKKNMLGRHDLTGPHPTAEATMFYDKMLDLLIYYNLIKE